MKQTCLLLSFAVMCLPARPAAAQFRIDDLPTLSPGRDADAKRLVDRERAALRFDSSKRVVVAEISGPATITMIHFAMPGDAEAQPRSAAEDLLGRRRRSRASIVRWSISSATRRACGTRSIRPW